MLPCGVDISLHDLYDAAGIGVAGNFAGHLEQVGEAADFVNVVADSAVAPATGVAAIHTWCTQMGTGRAMAPATGVAAIHRRMGVLRVGGREVRAVRRMIPARMCFHCPLAWP